MEVDLLLILWLNKVSEAVHRRHLEQVGSDPNPRQRRRKKASSGAFPMIAGNLYAGISDGKHLASLLLHYVPHACTWNGTLGMQYH